MPSLETPIAHLTTLDSPIGPLLVATSERGICATSWLEPFPLARTLRDLRARGFSPVEDADDPRVHRWATWLEAYFAGEVQDLCGPVDLRGIRPFTERALTGICDIPHGQVRTYGEVATRIGMPGGAQAVGNAMGQNPIPVVIPCHRVVRAGNTMGHYTGGAHFKEALLAIEGVRFDKHPGQLALF